MLLEAIRNSDLDRNLLVIPFVRCAIMEKI
jgi:hypothetical protein